MVKHSKEFIRLKETLAEKRDAAMLGNAYHDLFKYGKRPSVLKVQMWVKEYRQREDSNRTDL